MKTHIGAKIIQGEPMDENTFISKYKHKETEDRETQSGYHVIYSNPDGSDYHSWSPKDVFENAYREVTEGEARMIIPESEDKVPPHRSQYIKDEVSGK